MEHSSPCTWVAQLPRHPDEGKPGLEKLVRGDIRQAKASYAKDVHSSAVIASCAWCTHNAVVTDPATTVVLEQRVVFSGGCRETGS